MKECIAHINLPETTPTGNGKREYKSNSSRLDDWAEGITIIKTILLSEATCYEASFLLVN
jgi:hypothetical protein